jgi:TPR repeat protein
MPGTAVLWRRLGQGAGRLIVAAGLILCPGSALADFDDALKAYEGGHDAAALRELKPLLAAGNPSAAWLLGRMVETGRGGGPADAAEAARLYRKAAEGGNLPGMLALAELHRPGPGIGSKKRRPKGRPGPGCCLAPCAWTGVWGRQRMPRATCAGPWLLGPGRRPWCWENCI